MTLRLLCLQRVYLCVLAHTCVKTAQGSLMELGPGWRLQLDSLVIELLEPSNHTSCSGTHLWGSACFLSLSSDLSQAPLLILLSVKNSLGSSKAPCPEGCTGSPQLLPSNSLDPG
uniref:Bm11917 n=1 Tax=Brugia malayi TaxID=6279 RepID=A0A1I9GDW6_BRUMA|nr:Bm11917 [Brugia malayi]